MSHPDQHPATPAREFALQKAVDFHRHSGSDDPLTVVETAREFLTFLLDVGSTKTTAGV